jgi:O-antigen/teichoic acid export membrane protein
MINRLRQGITEKLSGGLLGAGAILFISMTIVNGGNYAFNLILGRWLGPTAFSDLSLIVTIVLMSGFITAAFQLTSAKFAAVYSAEKDEERLAASRRWLQRGALVCGGVILLVFAAGAQFWQDFFHTESAIPFVILGIALPIYLVQGVDRGALQGQLGFRRLAGSYQAEMWTRLLASLVLVGLGLSVNGAVLAIGLSFAATWFIARRVGSWAKKAGKLSGKEKKVVASFAGPVILVFAGQILISNSDIIIVKRFFSPEAAGQYAAVALIGRIVFFATWSMVTALFPIVAQKQQRGESHRHLLGISLGVVAIVSAAIIVFTIIAPELIINTLFGQAYVSVAPMLWLYALATALYALANVIVNYRLSAGSGKGTWFALGAGIAQVALLLIFHESMKQVIVFQIVLMASFLVVMLIWDQWLVYSQRFVPQSIEVSSYS